MSLWEDGFCDDQPLRQREIWRVLGRVGKDHRFLQQLLLLPLQMCPIGLFPHSSARSGDEPPQQLLSMGRAMLVPQLSAPTAVSPSYSYIMFSLLGIATVQLQVCIR